MRSENLPSAPSTKIGWGDSSITIQICRCSQSAARKERKVRKLTPKQEIIVRIVVSVITSVTVSVLAIMLYRP